MDILAQTFFVRNETYEFRLKKNEVGLYYT